MADHSVLEAAHQWALAARLARRHPSLHVVQTSMGAGNRLLSLTDFDTALIWVPEYVVHLPPPPTGPPAAGAVQALWRAIELGMYTIEEVEADAGIEPAAGRMSHQAFTYSLIAGVLVDLVHSDPVDVEAALAESQAWGSHVASWWDDLATVVEESAGVAMPRSRNLSSRYEAQQLSQYFRVFNDNFELVFDAYDAMVFGPSRAGAFGSPVGLHALAGSPDKPTDALRAVLELGRRDDPEDA
jgi:hypothetical protein